MNRTIMRQYALGFRDARKFARGYAETMELFKIIEKGGRR